MLQNIVILLASKCTHNFPPHLSCVAALPENTLATEQARFHLDEWLQKITDDAID